jgi:two-component system, cell cycle response regulator
MKVLVADDNPTMQIMVGGILKRWGHEPVSAADGKEAWRILQQPDAPRIVLLDWEMPGMDGVEVCRRVRAREKENAKYTYIILLTSRSEKQEVVAGIDAGADDYIIKPFDLSELHARMRTGWRIIELQMELFQRNEEYRRLSCTDPLTGCLNRRAILERLAAEMASARREGRIFGVSMIDIDHFKRINDSHGHAIGDDVLREFVRRLNQSMRASDAFGRIGGEEFLALWIPANSISIRTLNERFRLLVEKTRFSTPVIELPVTISIGVTTTSIDETADAVVARADLALYSGKSNGRNRVEAA